MERSNASSTVDVDEHSENDPASSEDESPEPLPKVLVRITVVKNGSQLPHPKSVTLDPNESFKDFKSKLHYYTCRKLDLEEDLVPDSDISHYISWQRKASANQKSRRHLTNDYSFLQTEEDWEAIVYDIRSCYSTKQKSLDNMLLCVVSKAEISNEMEAPNQGNDNCVNNDTGKRKVCVQIWHII